MKKKVNRAAVCSSENYQKSRRLHMEYLSEKHSHFNEMTVDGTLSFDQPIFKEGQMMPQYKTIRVFGHNMRVTIEEYNTHCKNL